MATHQLAISRVEDNESVLVVGVKGEVVLFEAILQLDGETEAVHGTVDAAVCGIVGHVDKVVHSESVLHVLVCVREDVHYDEGAIAALSLGPETLSSDCASQVVPGNRIQHKF